jgi:hypothetical protein
MKIPLFVIKAVQTASYKAEVGAGTGSEARAGTGSEARAEPFLKS